MDEDSRDAAAFRDERNEEEEEEEDEEEEHEQGQEGQGRVSLVWEQELRIFCADMSPPLSLLRLSWSALLHWERIRRSAGRSILPLSFIGHFHMPCLYLCLCVCVCLCVY